MRCSMVNILVKVPMILVKSPFPTIIFSVELKFFHPDQFLQQWDTTSPQSGIIIGL